MNTVRGLRAGFLLAGALLIVVCVATIASSYRWMHIVREVDVSQTILADLDSTVDNITAAETAERGFILTGESRYLTVYRQGAEQAFRLLDRLAAELPLEYMPDLHQLDRRTHTRLAELQTTIALRREHGFAEANAVILEGSGFREMTEIRFTVARMTDREQTHLATLNREKTRVHQLTIGGSIAGTLLALLVAMFSGFRAVRQLELRFAAEETLRESENRLKEAQETALLGSWSLDLRTDSVVWSPEVFRVFDIPLSSPALKAEELRDWIHPADRKEVDEATYRILRSGGTYDLHYRIVRRTGEVRHLQSRARAFRDAQGTTLRLVGTMLDVTEQSRVYEALRDSDAQFNAFMDNSPAIAFIKDRDGHMIYMNRICLQMWNLDKVDWRGKTDAELWTPQLAAEFRKLDHKVLDSGLSDSAIDTVPLPHGETCSLLSYKFPIRVAGGRRLLGGVSIDVTEQVAAERKLLDALAEKDALLREVHHRVKNNLQVISSLLGMQAANSEDPTAVAALLTSQERVQSMALIHELLYSAKSFGSIDFTAYVEQLVLQISASLGLASTRVALRLEAGPLHLEVDRAVPSGLILNELISNAFKHAFPGDRTGEIVVRIARCGDDELLLAVEDNGISLPRGFLIENTRSLGLRIVQILARQLDGKLFVGCGEGSCFEVRFPRTNQQADPGPAADHPFEELAPA